MRNLCASFLGGLVGAFLFLVFASYFFGHPFGDWFMSAHGIFSADKQKDLSEQDNIEIYRLLSRGLIVSSDGIISNITNLYGNMIQVLIGLLAAATVLGFFAVRWQSVQSAQEYVDGKTNAFFESKAFRDLVVETS
ncbi:hypothetical protein [Rhizobium leguminosarum]|uniref:hypothetical protein n=1 Tax=Rhizobium leguminosarum TaxID=384 RepID=UPI00103A0627|nr:hypothetical protein [Rhizobium leguminosarum]TBZ09429.1 hypothetical protein E0H33_25400 [Rhizobium leguminosarum bv. viciae]